MLRIILFCGVVIQYAHLFAQEGRGDLRFVWYNVENFFDTFDDSLIQDEEFIQGGIRQWTWDRFEKKAGMIAKVLAGAGGWKPPDIIGLAEIENSFTLYKLCRETPLLKYEYNWIHKDSPDRRGIDIALMYLPGSFQPMDYSFHEVPLKSDERTRDILYVKGLVFGKDTLHLILNHWPSRWDGKLATEGKRKAAATICRMLVDSIVKSGSSPSLMIAGDFNDEPDDVSIRKTLGVRSLVNSGEPVLDSVLYELKSDADKRVRGSLKYRGRWYAYDQIFVSGSLTDSYLPSSPCMRIYRPDFLIERDDEWTGMRPYRTWRGYKYSGGFSDHLPVYVDLLSVPTPSLFPASADGLPHNCSR
jgi:hypothetical protein